MATVYKKTDYYGLNLYGDNDPADLRDGYNGSMRAVDTALKKHADRLGTVEAKAKLGESIDSALGVSSSQEGAAAKSRWDNAASNASYAKNKADGNKVILNALGAVDAASAQAIKTDQEKTKADAKRALNLASQPDYLKRYLVVLGDSWVDGYYNSAKHPEHSPAIAIKEALSPNRFYYKGSSGGGFYRHGDDGTFADIWDNVPDKDKVTAVIIIGGQNDARADETASDVTIMEKARDLMRTIHNQAPQARIHICPMVLAVGQTLTNKSINSLSTAHRRVKIYTALTTGIKGMGWDYVRVHEGGYRIGAEVAKAPDGGDGGDGAHLSKDGYRWAGLWIAHCVANDIDLWPNAYADPTSGDIPGSWKYFNVYEHDGVMSIGLAFNYTTKPTEGQVLVRFPQWAAVGNPHNYPSYSGFGHYITLQDSSILIKGVGAAMPATGVISEDFVIPAGF